MPFDKPYENMMQDEGLGIWTDDPADPGGETYSGVSRVKNPKCKIWPYIDQKKSDPDFPENIRYDAVLLGMVKEFYYETFWVAPGFAVIDSYMPDLAEKMFNTGVNVGQGTVVEWLQRTLNILNRDQKSYPDIKVDGGFGKKSMDTLKLCLACNPKSRVMNVFRGYQFKHYIDWMERNDDREKFIGLFDRAAE